MIMTRVSSLERVFIILYPINQAHLSREDKKEAIYTIGSISPISFIFYSFNFIHYIISTKIITQMFPKFPPPFYDFYTCTVTSSNQISFKVPYDYNFILSLQIVLV